MATSLNKVIIIGNIGRDIERRYRGDGTAIANISVATSTRRKNPDRNAEQQWITETQWHRLTVWGDQAEWAFDNLGKGRAVYVEGRLRYGSYEKQGVKIPTVEIMVSHIEPFGAKRPAAGDDAGNSGAGADGAGAEGPQPGGMDEHRDWLDQYGD